jgi:hypothetical protein
MRQDPFPRKGAGVSSASHASPWWVGVALALAMLIYFRSAGYVVGRWLERHFGTSVVEVYRLRR